MDLHINDKRAVKLEKVFSSDYIPLFAGRPQREKVISQDDLLDLRIALHTSRDLADFFAHV